MANYVQNIRKYQKWIKEGRGQGRNEDYKPWLHVREVPSHGLSVRMPSLKAGRVLQLFSLNEFSPALLTFHPCFNASQKDLLIFKGKWSVVTFQLS